MMNENSTRAHTVLVLRLVQQRHGDVQPMVSSLFLADLGGSERVSKSGANELVKAPGGFVTNGEVVAKTSWEEYYACKERITETNYINNGLLSLKRCITALNDRQLCATAGRRASPVPFRESKLTAILEPALGGLSRTSIIVCCAPEECHAEETVQSLRFGEICSRVEHVHRMSLDPTAAVAKALEALSEEINDVQAVIRQKERWEWRQTLRADAVDTNDEATSKVQHGEEMELGGLGAVEIVPVAESTVNRQRVEHVVWGQQLVGAEVEHARLEALLDQRRRLLGEA